MRASISGLKCRGQLDGLQRQALIEVARWFIRFVEEEGAALGSLDTGASSDLVLERALDVGGVIEQSPDPVACAQGLGLVYEAFETPPPSVSSRVPTSAAINAKLMPLAEQENWSSLAETARIFRLDMSDEDTRRMADIAEFADTLVALADQNLVKAREGLVTSARILGASGSLITRALPGTRLLAIAFDLFAAALSLSDKTAPSRGRIVTTIFEPTQALEYDRGCVPQSNCAANSAHQPFSFSALRASMKRLPSSGLLTWRARPKASASGGTSVVMMLPAATRALSPILTAAPSG